MSVAALSPDIIRCSSPKPYKRGLRPCRRTTGGALASTRQHGVICGEFHELVRIVDLLKSNAIALATIANSREQVAASHPRFKR